MSGGGGGNEETTTSVNIPPELQPLVEAQVGTGTRALGNLEGLVNQGQGIVAPFNPLQQLGMGMAADRALGAGGFFPTFEQGFLDIAQGRDPREFAPGATVDTLENLAGGGSAMDTISRFASGGGGSFGGGGFGGGMNFTPAQLESVVEGLPDFPGSALGGIGEFDPIAADLLSGDMVVDRDAIMDAQRREAQRGVLSTFGRRAAGGLGQAAVAEAIADSSARTDLDIAQLGLTERGQRAQFGLQERGQDMNLALQRQQQGLTERQQDINAILGRGELGLSERGQDLQSQLQAQQLAASAAQAAASRGAAARSAASSRSLQAALGMGDLQLRAALGLGNLGEAENARQFEALGMLPNVAMAGPNILQGIGGQIQQQQQAQMFEPYQLQQMLLGASGTGINPATLFGQTTTSPFQGGSQLQGALGGAGTGAAIGSEFGDTGTGVGALLGGLLGYYGGG